MLLLAALVAGWYQLRWPSFDESKVHPQLQGLKHPLRAFRASFYTDGGTIGIAGEDATGRQFKTIIPNRMMENQNYSLIVIGHDYKTAVSGTVPQEHLDENTRRMLARLIRDYEELDPAFQMAKDSGVMDWRAKWGCPLGQRLLRNGFPLNFP